MLVLGLVGRYGAERLFASGPEVKEKPYYIEADVSKFIAQIIDFMNHDVSVSNVMTSTEKIHEVLEKYNNRVKYELNE